MGARATEPTSTGQPARSGLRADPQAPGHRPRGQDQSQAAAAAQHSAKSLTRPPELHRSHGRSHAGVKGDEAGSTPPPLRRAPARAGGVAREESRLGGSRGVTATPPRGNRPSVARDLLLDSGGHSGPAPRPT